MAVSTTTFGNFKYVNGSFPKLETGNRLFGTLSGNERVAAYLEISTSSAANYITVMNINPLGDPLGGTLSLRGSRIVTSDNVTPPASSKSFASGVGSPRFDGCALNSDGTILVTVAQEHTAITRQATISIFEYDNIADPGDWTRIGYYTQADFPSIGGHFWGGIKLTDDESKVYVSFIANSGGTTQGFVKFNLSGGTLTLDGSPVYVGTGMSNQDKQREFVMSKNKLFYVNEFNGGSVVVYENTTGDTWVARPTITLANVQSDSGIGAAIQQVCNTGAITNDGNTLIIGITGDNFSITQSAIEGFVHYSWNGAAWVFESYTNCRDHSVDTTFNIDYFSQFIISNDGTRLIVGDGFNTVAVNSLTPAWIYFEWNSGTSEWEPVGNFTGSSLILTSYSYLTDDSFSFFLVPIDESTDKVILITRQDPVAVNDTFGTALDNTVTNNLNILVDNGSGADNIYDGNNYTLTITDPDGIAGLTVDSNAGEIIVPIGTAVGSYNVVYKWISPTGVESNTATASFTVINGSLGPLVAVADSGISLDRTTLPGTTIDVLANDTLSGRNPVTEVTVIITTPIPGVTLTVNASNEIVVPNTIPVGSYTFEYDIEDGLNGDTPTGSPALVSFHVYDPTYTAITLTDIDIGDYAEAGMPQNVDITSYLTGNLGGRAVNEVIISLISPPPGVTFDDATKTISFSVAVTEANYAVNYELQDKNTEPYTITNSYDILFNVYGPNILVVIDSFISVDRTTLPGNTLNVLANDNLAGRDPVDDVTVVITTPIPGVTLTVNASNEIVVPNTIPIGTHTFQYDVQDGFNANTPTGSPATVTLHIEDTSLTAITLSDINIGILYTEDFPDSVDITSFLTGNLGGRTVDEIIISLPTPPTGVTFDDATKTISFSALATQGVFSIDYEVQDKNTFPYTTTSLYDIQYTTYGPIVLNDVGPVDIDRLGTIPVINVLSTSDLGGRTTGDVTVVYISGTGNPTYLSGFNYTVPSTETIGSYSFIFEVEDNTKVGDPQTTQNPTVSYVVFEQIVGQIFPAGNSMDLQTYNSEVVPPQEFIFIREVPLTDTEIKDLILQNYTLTKETELRDAIDLVLRWFKKEGVEVYNQKLNTFRNIFIKSNNTRIIFTK